MKVLLLAVVLLAMCEGEEPAAPEPPPPGAASKGTLQKLTAEEAAAVAKAKRRFEDFMRFWREGGTDYHREGIIAASLWARGRRQLGSGDELNDATHYFDRWRTEQKLLVPKISYYIQDYHWVIDHTEVDVVINGKALRVGIPTKEMPLFWVK